MARVIAETLVGNTSECKTYAVFDHIDDRTYHGDLVIQMTNDSKKNTFLDNVLTKEPKPRGNFFSLKRIYLNEGVVIAVNHNGFDTVYEEQVHLPLYQNIAENMHQGVEIQSPKNRNHFIKSHS